MKSSTVYTVFFATLSGFLAPYVVSALSPQISTDFDWSAQTLGLAVSVFFTFALASSVLTPTLLSRRRLHRGIPHGMALVGAAALILAAARSAILMIAVMAAVGILNGYLEPAGNSLVASQVRAGRKGATLGIKQSAVPAATLTAGALAVSGIPWRLALGVIAAALVIMSVAVRHGSRSDNSMDALPDANPEGAGHLWPGIGPPVALAFTGGAAANAVIVHVSGQLLTLGVSAAVAGSALVLSSLIGGTGRVLAGWLADWRGFRPRSAIIVIFGSALASCWAMAIPDLARPVIPALVAIGALLSWQGLINLWVVQRFPLNPGRATGISQAAIYAGGVVGPFAAGSLFERTSGAGWVATGAVLGAGIMTAALADNRRVKPAEPA